MYAAALEHQVVLNRLKEVCVCSSVRKSGGVKQAEGGMCVYAAALEHQVVLNRLKEVYVCMQQH